MAARTLHFDRMRFITLVALAFCVLFTNTWLSAADPARVPWTTSKVAGSPEPPPPYKAVRAFPEAKFEKPLLMVRCPGSDRLFISEQSGALYSLKNEPKAKPELCIDLKSSISTLAQTPNARQVESLYGLAFHPDYATNRQCFVCYTLSGSGPGSRNLPEGTRVSRFTMLNTEPPRIDPASEQIVLTFLQGGHNGGDLHFGPDRMLYISTGDAASPNPPDPSDTGQDISDLLSSILRIDIDRHDPGKFYAVPPDNPFVTLAGARPEVWAYGFRNPWRMSFDRQTGELFVGDVGWELWELVHRVEKGGNYGWSAMEGPQPVKPEKIGPTPIQPPLLPLPHTEGASVTGGYIYRGKKLPELVGAYIFGDWETRRLWAARFEGDRVTERIELIKPNIRVSAFGEDHAGEIYFLDHDTGFVHTLERSAANTTTSTFPRKLSDTGIFAATADQKPSPGVLPYQINSRQWQDGATAEHWIGLPGDASIKLYAQPKPIPGMVYWHNFRMHFPEGTVLTKTISWHGRRLETQILHYDDADWQPYTYAWRQDQTDADLVPNDGDEIEVEAGGEKLNWPLHSRSQCRLCHSSWSEYALGFQPEQLNRPASGTPNQLITFGELGLIQRIGADNKPLPTFDEPSAAKERKLVDPYDTSKPLEDRARSYLHANCGHCHAFGGGGAVALRLQYPVKVAEMDAVNIRPTRGDLGLPDACLIKPGDPAASTLYFRMAKFGRDRMPHLGSHQPDEAGLALIEQWIKSLGDPPASTAAPADNLEQQLSNPHQALPLARRLGRNEIENHQRTQLLTAVTRLPTSPLRDLFDGYLPGDASSRKLGSGPNPKRILALTGDPARGESLFWSTAVNCGTCHKIGDRGGAVGPELNSIGKQRTREELLESLLEPSRRIDPKYAAFVAQSSDGRILTGLVVSRTATEVILRDAQNKDIVLKADAVEHLRPARTSLMPEGQMASLTQEQAADLLAYLAARKN